MGEIEDFLPKGRRKTDFSQTQRQKGTFFFLILGNFFLIFFKNPSSVHQIIFSNFFVQKLFFFAGNRRYVYWRFETFLKTKWNFPTCVTVCAHSDGFRNRLFGPLD